MASERIKVFVTGGTFDKQYNELTGELFFQDTHLHDMLKLGRCLLNVDIETLMMIDSLRMTDADRVLIRDRCAACPERRIVITHGTDTMEQTAAVLRSAIRGKTIVLTGAMVPYQFGSSDGMFNLGTALNVRAGARAWGLRGYERALFAVCVRCEKTANVGCLNGASRNLSARTI